MKNELLAPNGKPSNLNTTQYELVRTPAFKKWFGDWENDPANASKVIDENGEPQVCYHGTFSENLNSFDEKKIGHNTGNEGHYGYGFYFSYSKIEASTYTYATNPIILECFLNIRNPFLSNNIDHLEKYSKDYGYYEEKKPVAIDSYWLLSELKKRKDQKPYLLYRSILDNGYEKGWSLFLEKNKIDWDAENFDYNRINDWAEYDSTKQEFSKENEFENYNDEIPEHILEDISEQLNIPVSEIKTIKQYTVGNYPRLLYMMDLGNRSRSLTNEIKKEGFDGIIAGSEIVLFNSNQIKLADGTNTTFDSENDDIRFEQGGKIDLEIISNRKGIIDYLTKNSGRWYQRDFGELNELFDSNAYVEQDDEIVKELSREYLNFYRKNPNFKKIPLIIYENKISKDFGDGELFRYDFFNDVIISSSKKEFNELKNLKTIPINDICGFVLEKYENKIYGALMHEYGHYIVLNKVGYIKDDWFNENYNKIVNNISVYAGEKKVEFLAEVFTLKNIPNFEELGKEKKEFVINNYDNLFFEKGGEIGNFKDFYNELKIEDGSKYIGQKFGNVFPFLGKKNRFVPNDFRIMVKQYNGVLSRLEKNEYSSKSIKQRDLNKLERIKKYIDKKEFLGNFYLDSTGTIVDFKSNEFEKGGRTIAQTPAPKEDRVYGSDKNKNNSSKDLSSAKLIKFDDNTLDIIKNKVKEHNNQYPDKKINLSSAKAVVRRGMGAYSKSHRPTISGGKPNSRVAWGLARLNAFTYKILNGKSKSGKYTQDDDLIEELGFEVANYQNGGEMKKDIRCINCGWEWNKKNSELWDMYICHKCGFDNTTFYTSIPIKNYSKGGQTEKTNPNYLKMFLDL